MVLLAKHSLGFHARAERLGEGFAVPVNRGDDQRILASLKLFHHIGDQRLERVGAGVALPNQPQALDLLECCVVALGIVIFDDFEQLRGALLPVDFLELRAQEHLGIDGHLERVPALNGAVLSRVAANHQAAPVSARKLQ